jgi:CubicO group peptidase (beta-lactamase class C family)
LGVTPACCIFVLVLLVGARPVAAALPDDYFPLLTAGVVRLEAGLSASPDANLATPEAKPGWWHFPSAALTTFEWRSTTPELEQFGATKLDALWTNLLARGTTAFLVIRNDAIVFERYAEGWSRTRPHYTASLAKALVGGLSLMLAVEDERIQPDDRASRFVPRWRGLERKQDITIAHLAPHTSGIEDAQTDGLPHDQLPGWKGEFWKRLPPPRDPFSLARDAAPVLDVPGTRARYSNPGMAMLAWCVTASLRGAAHPDLRSLLRGRLIEPLGVPESEWSVGYGATTEVEGLPLVANWGGGGFSPNAVARVGRLLLHGGDWQGRQLLQPLTVTTATTHADLPSHSGLGWRVNREANGSPTNFSGANLRSPTGEQKGDGGAGRKASGLLCVEGVLYLWARNATNAQIAWSPDHGATWTWSDWRFTNSFGCPAFVNFGRDYAGARDEFVYLVSPDSDSAYEPADRLVLARVPKHRLRERAAYEFFVKLDPGGGSLWTRDLAQRGAVFTNPGRCLRSQMTCCAPLKRYLWWQQLPNAATAGDRADSRFLGGFGVYDAPEPWGPWTTAYFTERWDVGPGETASLPAKWRSADGRTLHLVFSGDDRFSVRRAELILRAELRTDRE